jgi:hypothetical protein
MNAEQTIAKLQVVEDMTTDNAVKQLCKIMQEYVKSNNKTRVGFVK